MTVRIRYLLVALAIGSAPPVAAKPVETWGKPGVSFDQYRLDAVACASAAARRDVEDDAETTRFVKGFRNLERENSMPRSAARR